MCLNSHLTDAYPSLKRLWPGPASLPEAKPGPAPLTFVAGTLLITSQSWQPPSESCILSLHVLIYS